MVLDQTGQVIRHGTSDLNELPSCNETEVVIPTHLVNFIDIQLPEVPSKKLETTLPFIVEEFVLSSPEDVHVVIASRIGDQATLAVIQKAWIKNCVSALSRAKLQAKRMFPDCLLLAHKEDAWTIAQLGKSILVRTSQTKGFAFDLTGSNENEVPYLLLAAFKEKDQFSTPNVFQAYGECAETITGWAIKLGIQGGRQSTENGNLTGSPHHLIYYKRVFTLQRFRSKALSVQELRFDCRANLSAAVLLYFDRCRTSISSKPSA